MLILKSFIKKLVHPRSSDEDARRKEFILNILLLSSIVLFAIANIVNIFAAIFRPASHETQSISFLILLFILCFFTTLYLLSRKGYFDLSAHVLTLTFFLLSAYMGYRWGVDITASLLIYGLVIVMAGILVSTRFAFLSTALVGMTIIVTDYLQDARMVLHEYSWRLENWALSDTIMTVIIFLVIAVVSWLSNREIERSLARAHRSEKSLREERDNLEIIVEERTKKLKQTQLEKVAQLYRFAEFGRLSSGLFHDLMSPLTAVSLNMDRAKSEEKNKGDINQAQKYLDQAFVAAKRMERFIMAVRKQINKDDENKNFSPLREIEQVIDILSHKAEVSKVNIIFSPESNAALFGAPIRFSQIMLNLITNAIDAYDGIRSEEKREVLVRALNENGKIKCTVTDRGIGIREENLEKIFEPFFTTKARETTKGTGIGLSMVKEMAEKDFHGTVSVTSDKENGTVFTLVLPA